MQTAKHSRNRRWYLQYKLDGAVYLDRLPNFESLEQNSKRTYEHECFHLTSSGKWQAYKRPCAFLVLKKSRRLIKLKYPKQADYDSGILSIHFSDNKRNEVIALDWRGEGSDWKEEIMFHSTSMPPTPDFDAEVDPPQGRKSRGRKGHANDSEPRKKRDRSGDQERNIRLGTAGEKYILKVLNKKLQKSPHHKKKTATHVADVSNDYGYDIKSWCMEAKCRISGSHRVYIEVKTTEGGKKDSFYVSPKELKVAHEEGDHYLVYRVYNFKKGGISPYYVLTGKALSKDNTMWHAYKDKKKWSTYMVRPDSYLVSP